MCEAKLGEVTPNAPIARQDAFDARAEVACKSSIYAVYVRWECKQGPGSQKGALTIVPFSLGQVKVVDNNVKVLRSQVVELLQASSIHVHQVAEETRFHMITVCHVEIPRPCPRDEVLSYAIPHAEAPLLQQRPYSRSTCIGEYIGVQVRGLGNR